MLNVRRATIVVAFIFALIFLTSFVPKALNPTPRSPDEQKRDSAWVASSPYWLDRQACRWFSVCGIHHMRWDDPTRPRGPPVPLRELGELELKKRSPQPAVRESMIWEAANGRTRHAERSRSSSGRELHDIPDFVLRNAPLIHLYSGEHFWPSDIAEHVRHMTPYVDHAPVNITEPLSLENLHDLSAIPGVVFLTSDEDVEQRPDWLSSLVGQPKPFDGHGDERVDSTNGHRANQAQEHYSEGTTWFNVDKDHPLQRIADPRERVFETRERASKLSRRARLATDQLQKPFPQSTPGHKPDASGYSAAPAILVLVDKGSGILDAFWFFFYSYNLGQTVLDMRFGNHVGDWEHCMVRFENGVPRAMFLSEHEGGQAYAWAALEKQRMNFTTTVLGRAVTDVVERPVIYSAVGSHAMYAFPGPHAYVLPFQMLKDETDRGPMWDPSLNKLAYFYDYTDSPPPPEDDEGNQEDDLTLEEARPYPFDVSAFETHAHRNSTALLSRRGQPVLPTSLTPAASNPDAPTSWFHFDGPWGDELYGLGDQRQWRLFGQYHYVTGPMGPKFKHLGRDKVCQTERCRILYSIEEGRRSSWHD